ncbi:MAG: hypothetical protein PF569_09160 [Candidatus Woesearchaeota archaeon]|jgi:hypothetical protein|nr:hypothetical protein [Candidatus Woesearchaeota archaeon]
MDKNLINQQDLNTKIKEQVKETFFNLLPDEAFQELVEKEVKEFFEATISTFKIKEIRDDCGWNGSHKGVDLETQVSPFRLMVWNETKKHINPKIEKIFKDEDLWGAVSDSWNPEGGILSAKLDQLLEEKTMMLAKSFFQNMFTESFLNSKYEIVQEVKDHIDNDNNQY